MFNKAYIVPATFGVVGACILAIGLYVSLGVEGYRSETVRSQQQADERYATLISADKIAKDAIRKAQEAQTVIAWNEAVQQIEALTDPGLRELLLASTLPQRIIAESKVRDQFIAQAFEVAQKNSDDPQIEQLINSRARPYHERIKLLLVNLDNKADDMRKALPEDEWKEWYRAMRYLEGYTQFSELTFLPGDQKQKALDAIKASREAFQKIFEFYPKDTRTEYAIESLDKVSKQQESESGKPKNAKKPRLLQRPSIGPSMSSPTGRGI